jgi:hypothetical protein
MQLDNIHVAAIMLLDQKYITQEAPNKCRQKNWKGSDNVTFLATRNKKELLRLMDTRLLQMDTY